MAVFVKKSNIHGVGMFAINQINKDKAIGKLFVMFKGLYHFTRMSTFVNHSASPNCTLTLDENKNIVMLSKEKINTGDELTCNYRDLLKLNVDLTHLNINYEL
jgi:SET domain-containing protein